MTMPAVSQPPTLVTDTRPLGLEKGRASLATPVSLNSASSQAELSEPLIQSSATAEVKSQSTPPITPISPSLPSANKSTETKSQGQGRLPSPRSCQRDTDIAKQRESDREREDGRERDLDRERDRDLERERDRDSHRFRDSPFHHHSAY